MPRLAIPVRGITNRMDHVVARGSAAVVGLLVIVAVLGGACSASEDRAGDMPRGALSSTSTRQADDSFRTSRLAMVDAQIAARDVEDGRVLDAMRTVPRHEFVPQEQVDRAYEDRPLPIGEGQTISQPYTVALMTELLDVQPGDVVLEIGTGSGYQAAVLAELTDRVYTVEILPKLARQASRTLDGLGYTQVKRKIADGYFGWPQNGLYDGIIVTAAPDHIPAPLVEQLKEGGRMVIPVGPPGSYQTLWRLTKQQDRVISENITDVAFVPLVRKG
ncbi:MAG TPA: protein-L-isoaspartate(D-aspartate) O-methyltransferase [Acidimicrobiales bacterium]|nr:protein-L-isoaspartate(D-aspartate) O-methyltransferase [Acidimicrobiales bacterium]